MREMYGNDSVIFFNPFSAPRSTDCHLYDRCDIKFEKKKTFLKYKMKGKYDPSSAAHAIFFSITLLLCYSQYSF